MGSLQAWSACFFRHKPVHHIGAKHVLDTSGNLGAFVKEFVLEHECHPLSTGHRHRFELRFAPFISFVQIDHECEQACLAVGAGEGAVEMPGESLPWDVSIVTKALIETACRPASPHV